MKKESTANQTIATSEKKDAQKKKTNWLLNWTKWQIQAYTIGLDSGNSKREKKNESVPTHDKKKHCHCIRYYVTVRTRLWMLKICSIQIEA